jgi:hypothetical protein
MGSTGLTGLTGDTGPTGATGLTGLGFSIAKTYSSVANLNADTAPTDIVPGQFAIIDTGNVQDAEDSRLYLWTGTSYVYTTDLSGAAGIKGDTGATGPRGATGTAGATGPIGATGFGLTGLTGSTGPRGYAGSIGATGLFGATGATGAGYTGSRGTGYTGSVGDTGPAFSGTTDGQLITSNTAPATDTLTGALQVAGGAGIGGNVYVGENIVVIGNIAAATITTSSDVVVGGNLTVHGVTTVVDSNTVSIGDLNIVLGQGSTNSAQSDGGGISVSLGTDGFARIEYAHAYNAWYLTNPLRVEGTGNFTGTVSADEFKDPHLVAGRILIAGASGLITDDQYMTYTSGTRTLAVGNVSATIDGGFY